jgi:hypothetical protein
MNSMPPAHARGFLGEQSMGFFLGERGYIFVDGPSGSKEGFGVTVKGFDGVAFNPKTHHLIIYDNKAYAAAGARGPPFKLRQRRRQTSASRSAMRVGGPAALVPGWHSKEFGSSTITKRPVDGGG